MITLEQAKVARDEARGRALAGLRPEYTAAAIDAYAAAERALQLEQVGVWLDGAPARMEEKTALGAMSPHPMYNVGQLSAVRAIANDLRSGAWKL